MSTTTNNALEAEIYDILVALKWIKRKNWRDVILSSDCLRGITILQEKSTKQYFFRPDYLLQGVVSRAQRH